MCVGLGVLWGQGRWYVLDIERCQFVTNTSKDISYQSHFSDFSVDFSVDLIGCDEDWQTVWAAWAAGAAW